MAITEDTRLRALVETHSRALLRYLARRGVPEADLDDALQEVFVVTATKLAQVPVGSERAFLFGSAVRIAGNARRGQRRKLRAQDEMVHTSWDSCATVEELTDRLRARDMLEEVVEHLPEEVQVVFRLFEIDGEPIADIAERLGLPIGTIASRLRRGRAALHRFCTRANAARVVRTPLARSGVSPNPEVLSWWGSGGEADALSALADIYQFSHPNHHVVRATAGSAGQAKRQLRTRMEHGAPPSTFLVNGGADLYAWVRRDARQAMDPIDFLFKCEGWSDALPADLIDLVTYGGRAYAVPMNIHRTNTLFYNKHVLAKLGVAPPSTLDELHDIIGVAKEHRIAPLALGWRDPWTLTHLAFENVMVAVTSGAYYREFFEGSRSARDAELRAVLAELMRLIEASNEGAEAMSWQDAADLLGSGQAAMMVMGDWAKAYLASSGWRVGVDFDQVPMPGTRGTFVFATDTFGLPKSTDGRSAIDLLKVFGSESGQASFNLIKGSIPARADVDLSGYDVLARATARDFRESVRYPGVTSLAPSSFLRVADRALARFAIDGDAEDCIATIRQHYDWLRSRIC